MISALIALFAVPLQSALAAGGTISDGASCEAIGGTWEDIFTMNFQG